MQLPKKVKVGTKWYTFHYVPAARGPWLGRITYNINSVSITTHAKKQPRPAADIRETFWHELTHAILHSMDNPLHLNERFVTDFSHLLSKAIDSARFHD